MAGEEVSVVPFSHVPVRTSTAPAVPESAPFPVPGCPAPVCPVPVRANQLCLPAPDASPEKSNGDFLDLSDPVARGSAFTAVNSQGAGATAAPSQEAAPLLPLMSAEEVAAYLLDVSQGDPLFIDEGVGSGHTSPEAASFSVDINELLSTVRANLHRISSTPRVVELNEGEEEMSVNEPVPKNA